MVGVTATGNLRVKYFNNQYTNQENQNSVAKYQYLSITMMAFKTKKINHPSTLRNVNSKINKNLNILMKNMNS